MYASRTRIHNIQGEYLVVTDVRKCSKKKKRKVKESHHHTSNLNITDVLLGFQTDKTEDTLSAPSSKTNRKDEIE